MKRDWSDKSWLRSEEESPTLIEVLGWIVTWAIFLGLLLVLMSYEPALRC